MGRVPGSWAVAVAAALAVPGCGGGKVAVSGVVTLDGSPVEGVIVTFLPVARDQGQTIQPINWPINPTTGGLTAWKNCNVNCTDIGVNPANCLWNWHTTWGFKSNHTGGANFCFGDGSVRFVQQDIDMRTYQYLGCRDDRQPVQLP